MTDGRTRLARRAARLDAVRSSRGPSAGIEHFIEVMERVTTTDTPTDIGAMSCASPTDADALLGNSRLLARLTDAVPEIVAGPLRLDAQYWVCTGKPRPLPDGWATLSESLFVGVSDAATVEVSTKPFCVGLFTSTGVMGAHGMWRAYLDINRGSTLHPLPWHTWAVEPRHDVTVYEIASAARWVDFVLSHPQRQRGLLFPDWRSVARHDDGVHMTLRAIAATQGMYFQTEQGIVAAPYGDVESTLWLRWCCGSARLVETVE